MHVLEHAHPATFLNEAQALFASREVEHNLLLGVLKAVAEGRYQHSTTLVWGVYDTDESLVGAVVQTPPHPVLISALPTSAIPVLAESLLEHGALPFRTMALDTVSEPLCAALCRDPSLEARRVTRMRLFQLERVIPPPRTPGKLRRAGSEDRATLATYFKAFHVEALSHEPWPADADKVATSAIATGQTFLWEHGDEPVCLASYGRAIGGGASIGPVYTPPAQRGRGYASALVAALSQQLLDGGRSYTCLFTDLSNQTSNKIYARVGYRAVSDFSQWDIMRTSAA